MGIEYYAYAIFIAALVCIVAIVFKVLFSNVKTQNKLLDERETQILQTYNAVETIMEEFQDQAKATIEELKLREQEYRAALQNMAAFQLPPELEKREQAVERVPRTLPLDANRIKAAQDVIERAERLVIHESAPVESPRPATRVHRAVPVVTSATAAAPPIQATPPAASAPSPAIAAKTESKPAVFQSFFEEAIEAPPPTPYSPAAINGGSRRDAILAMADEGKTDVEIASELGITRNEVQLVIGLTK